MFDMNDKKPFHHGVGGLFPPEKPHFTLQEDMLHTITEMRQTIDRLLKFEQRVENEVHDLMSKLTSDNCLFKDTFANAHTLFTQEIKNEVNLFEQNVDNTVKLFTDNLTSEYEGLGEQYQTQHVENLKQYEEKLKKYVDEVEAEYDSFKESITSQIDSSNTMNADASAEFQRRITTELNTFTADMNQKYKNFTDYISASQESFQTTWTDVVEERLDAQDEKLANAEAFMRTNLEATVRTELGDMYDSGDFAEILEGEVFNTLEERLNNIEETTEPLAERIAANESNDKNLEKSMSTTLGYQKKNLVKNTAQSQTINGITFTVNDDGTVIANGTATENTALKISYVPLKKNTSYILSGLDNYSLSTVTISLFNTANHTSITALHLNPDFTVGSSDVNVEVRCVVYKGYTADGVVYKPMIRPAEIADDTYEPYVDDVKTRLDNLLARVIALETKTTTE